MTGFYINAALVLRWADFFCFQFSFHMYLCVSGGNKFLFFGKFGVLCFLVTSVLRFALFPYHRQTGTIYYYIFVHHKCSFHYYHQSAILTKEIIFCFVLQYLQSANIYQTIYVSRNSTATIETSLNF